MSNCFIFEFSSSNEPKVSYLTNQSFQQQQQQQQQNSESNATQNFPLPHVSNYDTPGRKINENQQVNLQDNVEEDTFHVFSDSVSSPSTTSSSPLSCSNLSSFYSDDDMEVINAPPVLFSIPDSYAGIPTCYYDKETDADDEYDPNDEDNIDSDDTNSGNLTRL
jgi:hypothetical protein